MKLVTAIIRPAVFDTVKHALAMFDVQGLTVTEAYGSGGQPTIQIYRGQEWLLDLAPRIKIEVLVTDLDVHDVAHVISRAAATGRAGDGMLWVTEVLLAVRIRTGERGADAAS
jgi:nitrogen regulatory protein P-II 1